MQTASTVFYLSSITVGLAYYFAVVGTRQRSQYSKWTTQTLYKAYPDYVNGSVYFYEKQVRNTVKDL
mgnify:FL=1